MKCIILAGGKGERLWPLSRQDFPKQFIQIQERHSIFQETIARNMAYCDEFIIITSYGYRSIIANQMEAFQGVTYRCIFEEVPRHTTAAIALACLDLQPSEYVFAVPANHLIDTGDCDGMTYKDAILTAKESAKNGRIAVFGIETSAVSKRFGYFTENGKEFIEKPDEETAERLKEQTVYQNLGMLLFQSGIFLNEMKRLCPSAYEACVRANKAKKAIPEGILYEEDILDGIEPVSVEHSILEHTDKISGIVAGFGWSDIGRLEDLNRTKLIADGTGIVHGGSNTEVINRSSDKAVVVNGLDDVLVVNTDDAVYVGRRGESFRLKEIIRENEELSPYASQGSTVYRPWGYRKLLAKDERYLIRKVVLLQGKTINEHKHSQRTESWVITEGSALIGIDGKAQTYHEGESVSVPAGVLHQISNPAEKPLVFIETVTGDDINDADMISSDRAGMTERELGFAPDMMVKLAPAYKDYLWGGTKLRDVYNKQCDYDVIAESWELSAHPAGSSIVASGRHKGLTFGKYLDTTGKDILGWKCAHLQSFPILIKFIDADKDLSVQVHPDDEYALTNENEYGKNEMWYVIDSEPGAGLYVGFRQDVSREEVAERVKNGTILEVLNFYPTKSGDVFFIPAGTVHAIGAGNLICEIQQSSNTTYRLYDYDRRDKFGNPRELHLDKALDVLDYSKYQPVKLGLTGADGTEKTVRCKYFETVIYDINGSKNLSLKDDSFHSAVCIRGEGTIRLKDDEMQIKAGDSIFIPAVTDIMEIEGKLSLVITRI